MINPDSVKAVNAARIHANTVRPLYDSYCFSRIPGTVYNLLTGSSDPALPPEILPGVAYDKVILLFIDAFGWRFFEQYSDHPFLQRFIKDGIVSKLTSQFPSTTAAHYTTMQTGLEVGQHGIFEKTYYEPLVDSMIAPLIFSYGDERAYNSLYSAGIAPEAFYPKVTLSQRLSEKRIKPYLFQDRDTYSDIMANGAHTIVPFRTLPTGLVNLAEAVAAEPDRAFFFLYFGVLDAVAHAYGPGSRQFAAEVDACLTAIERLILPVLKTDNTLLIVTADHGHTEISPETTIYLNEHVPDIARMIKTNQRGEMLTPCGSPRDYFLYIRQECLDEAQQMLTEAFEGHADVRSVRDLIAQGYFGSVSDTFLGRAADLVILPHDHGSVWWGRDSQTARGYHGGLSANEMETVFMALKA
jgi:hypothetical protein